VEDLITLDNVRPHPLKLDNNESIWKTVVNLECGQFYQIISPSGTGKSTLIGILNGIRTDYDGILYYDRISLKNIQNDKWGSLRNSKISTVYQDLKLFGRLTALENISLLNAFQINKKSFPVDNWCKLLGIEEKLHTYVDELSYGQKQRVAIIRALNRDFKWLLLDEPFSHLDSKNIDIAMQMIVSECKTRAAGIIITGLDERFTYQDFKKLII
jgi:ABC-type lipoprotein export system ATPase subunit